MSGLPAFESGAALLAEGDPGPIPFVVDELLVARSVAFLQGAPKAGKSYLALDLAVSIASAQPALGRFGVKPGAVALVAEESGRGGPRCTAD